MLARAHSFTIDGLEVRPVAVEVDVRSGLPAFAIVGLADTAVREARERIRAAIRNAGYEFPARRITANLAPGDLPKAGAGFDLALACAVLAASGQIPAAGLERIALHGELGLDGCVRAVRGALAVAQAACDGGLEALAVASGCASQAALAEGLEVLAVGHLRSAVRVLEGGAGDPYPDEPGHSTAGRMRGGAAERGATGELGAAPDIVEVHGQHHAVRALVIAAAGGHNCLLSGPPGCGKTMLAQRVVSILPPLSSGEAIEVARIRGLFGEGGDGLPREPPLRAPHHSITAAGMVGGALRGSLGEVVLAHNGVLFLDELSEFTRTVLEALRQPLEDGRVAIARARHGAVHPARFMLLAATNPCPCGYAGEGERCACSESAIARHRRRLSGPLLDRIDLQVAMRRSGRLAKEPLMDSARARELVLGARDRQRDRLGGLPGALNATLDGAALARTLRLDEDAEQLVRRAGERGLVSARGELRALRVARTIADLEGSARVRRGDVGQALALRTGTGADGRWAA